LPLIGRSRSHADCRSSARSRHCSSSARLPHCTTDTRTAHAQLDLRVDRLADAVPHAASREGGGSRGARQQAAFPQLQDSRDEFANYLNVLQNGGIAFARDGARAPPRTRSSRAASTSSRKRWPDIASAASQILAAQKDLVALAKNIAQIRAAAEEWPRSRRSSPAHGASGSTPAQVIRASRLTFLSERLGRGAAEILGAEIIDPRSRSSSARTRTSCAT
jgi:hypothetical protein